MTENPYKPLLRTDSPANVKILAWKPAIQWVGIFIVNLPVPLYFGLQSTSGSSTAAMFATTALIFLAGASLCRPLPGLMRTVTIGGILTALSQFAPGLQLIAGLIGFAVSDAFRHRDIKSGIANLPSDDVTGAFVVTLITATIVLCAAAVSGACIQLVLTYLRRTPQNKAATAI